MSNDDKLVIYAKETGLEPASATSLAECFRPVYEKARAAIAECVGVAESVKDATCVKEIKRSRACRLQLRSIRIESESTRKKQKESALLYGRAVDGFHNILMADLVPLETALSEAEAVAERAEAARLQALKESRMHEISPYLDSPCILNLSEISEADYQRALSDAKLLKKARIEAAEKAAAEAKAKSESERIERERIKVENDRLKAEAIAVENARKAEREAAEAKLKAAQEVAMKELSELEAKAKAEADQLRAIAEYQRKKIEAANLESNRLKLEQERKQLELLKEQKRLKAAPDNSKAQAFADQLRAMKLPEFSTDSFSQLAERIEDVSRWIEGTIKRNGGDK